MSADLELTVLQAATEDCGYVAGFALTDQMLIAVGGQSNRQPTVLASSNARQFEARKTPRELGLRDVLAVGNIVWTCGEYGQLAVSRDHGASWGLVETGMDGCLYALALGGDGSIWCTGDDGYAARVVDDRAVRIDLSTTTRLSSVYPMRDEIIVLGFDGKVRRWRNGTSIEVGTGATRPLTALAITRTGTWVVVGDGGFIARSPDGSWFSRVKCGVEVDLEGIASLADGRLVIVGDRGHVLVSSDDGRTWKGMRNDLGLAHLWSVERFGGGVLIGGDEGLIVKLAPIGDATWADRVNVFGDAKPLDAAFANGPIGFIDHGLDEFLGAPVAVRASQPRDPDDALSGAGTAADFRDIYGVPLPREAERFFAQVAGHDRWSTFEEVRLDNDLRPDVGDKNLFELMLLRNQQAYLGTDLVEAFCGVFGVGSQGNGDTYHMEIYEWDGPRQVLHFDHESHAFSGVFADSLDSLVYLSAIVKAFADKRISQDAFEMGIRRLRGRLKPTWHFSIEDKDPAFVMLEPKRRDTEFFFYRSRWICALLQNDGVTEVDDVPGLFMADLNQTIPSEQLPARYEACEKFIPTALYAMWRAYLFDEPELDKYLEISRVHGARLVRDAAWLIDELRGGRSELGTIKDVRAWLAAFRALDLDPRRAPQRALEVAASAKLDADRKHQASAELAATPRAQWTDLAWRWVNDGAAHRALLEELDRDGAGTSSLIAALDELGELHDDEREAAIARLASELPSELEALLVGSLVRDDQLAGVLTRPPTAPVAEADDDVRSPGWEAIDRALKPIYGSAEPLHFGSAPPYLLGGNDPIHGISVYPRTAPVPHWHFVTYGFTDLFSKETDDPEESGFGFELTFRLARPAGQHEPPTWTLNFLQNLARYVFSTGNRFAPGHKMGLNGPIALDNDTRITAICFAEDPELTDIESELGKARFVQIVGITDEEYRLIQEWSTPGLVEILRKRLPYLVTDLLRPSVLDDPGTAREVETRVTAEGSSEDLTFAGEMKLDSDDGHVRIELGALYAAVLPRAMRGRLRHGRPYELRGRSAVLQLRPASQIGYHLDDGELVLEITQELAREIEVQLRAALAGTYRFESWPALEIIVTPSFIRAQDGSASEVRGIADADEAARMVAAENTRLDGQGDDDDSNDVAGEAGGDDRPVPDPARVFAAVAMTERALLLAPDDSDIQFTHAMLLLDGERAGLAGKAAELLAWLPRFGAPVRINVAVRLGKRGHALFGEVVDLALGASLSASAFDDVPHELFSELGDAILQHAPTKLARLVPRLPDDVNFLSALAWKSIQAEQRDAALSLYDRLLALTIPDEGDERTNYLRAMNNACVQAHSAKAFDAAVRIADRAQPVAHENPYIFHSAACAYVAIGDLSRALAQVKLAIEHEYDHVGKIEVDADLGPLLESPEFKTLFRDWHARQEGN